MSNIAIFEKTKSLVLKQEADFSKMAKIHGAVTFEREASFALEALQNNAFLLKTASENQDSLKRAIINIAAIGLSLSPVHKYAYLVPRDGKVMLDLSYKGLVQLAIEAKSVKYVQAELVFMKDKFLLRGSGQEPIHERNPFDVDRGDFLGAYCIAQTYQGDYLVETMSAKEIFSIRDRSQSYKAVLAGKAKSCPWTTDEGEMCKKTVIRRASKSWPMTDTRENERFEKAINVFDETEAIDLNKIPQLTESDVNNFEADLSDIRSHLETLERTEERYLGHLERVNKREIKSLEDLSQAEIEQALVELKQLVSNKNKTLELKNENA